MPSPFPVSGRAWDELANNQRRFFQFRDDYLPLPPTHAAEIRLLDRADAARVADWAFRAVVPDGWLHFGGGFPFESRLMIGDSWNDGTARREVRAWLYARGVPFSELVYLVYERDEVVEVPWKSVVRYWDAFAWSVGVAMIAVDASAAWACGFHHEDVIVFGSRRPLPDAAASPSEPRP